MKQHGMLHAVWRFWMIGWMLALPVHATAPRFAPEMFAGDQTKTLEVYLLEIPPLISASAPNEGPLTEIIRQIFAANGIKVTIQLLPSMKLLKYYFEAENALAVAGLTGLSEAQSARTVAVPCYIKEAAAAPVLLLFNPNHPEGPRLSDTFTQGLIKLLRENTYHAIFEKSWGPKSNVAETVRLLQQRLAK